MLNQFEWWCGRKQTSIQIIIKLQRETLLISTNVLFHFSVLKGPMRDRAVQIPCENRWLRLGRYAGYPHPRQNAETAKRCMRQLRHKVRTSQWFKSLHACLRFVSLLFNIDNVGRYVMIRSCDVQWLHYCVRIILSTLHCLLITRIIG